MEEDPPESIFSFQVIQLCCVTCGENIKNYLLKRTGVLEVKIDLKEKIISIRGNILKRKLKDIFKNMKISAELVYYERTQIVSEEKTEDDDQRRDNEETEHCFPNEEEEEETDGDEHYYKRYEYKDHKPEKYVPPCPTKEENHGEHYRRNYRFKDHKPEKYVPPKQEFYWGDFRSGVHKRYPQIRSESTWFRDFPYYDGFNFNQGYHGGPPYY